jgi:hypothetical protein
MANTRSFLNDCNFNITTIGGALTKIGEWKTSEEVYRAREAQRFMDLASQDPRACLSQVDWKKGFLVWSCESGVWCRGFAGGLVKSLGGWRWRHPSRLWTQFSSTRTANWWGSTPVNFLHRLAVTGSGL